jgi:hypothetical protein
MTPTGDVGIKMTAAKLHSSLNSIEVILIPTARLYGLLGFLQCGGNACSKAEEKSRDAHPLPM